MVASTGQTVSHGACWQCWHIIGWWTVVGVLAVALEVTVDAQPVHDRGSCAPARRRRRGRCSRPGRRRRRRSSRCRRRDRWTCPRCARRGARSRQRSEAARVRVRWRARASCPCSREASVSVWTMSRPSIEKWVCAGARRARRPVFATFTRGASVRRTPLSTRASGIDVGADAVARLAGGPAAVADRHRDRAPLLAGLHERGQLQLAGLGRQRDDVAGGDAQRAWRSRARCDATLPQVRRVIGSGSSSSHGLLACRPSRAPTVSCSASS